MAIITFTSDFGLKDAYVAVVKASILNVFPEANIVDISHDILTSNIADGAFVLSSAFHHFPKGSVHLVAVDSYGQSGSKQIVVSQNGHYFISTDNGLLSLISPNEPIDAIISLSDDNTFSTFPAKDILAPAAAKLAKGESINALGSNFPEMKTFLERRFKATKKEISGHVIKIDNFGNLITNIRKVDFDILSKEKEYTIGFGRYRANKIQLLPNEVEGGDYYVLFNYQGLLEIGIRHGNAAELFGLQFDSSVWIKFEGKGESSEI